MNFEWLENIHLATDNQSVNLITSIYSPLELLECVIIRCLQINR
jgi:hypothetical protein